MAEQGYMMKPLEVFAIDGKMNRCTGSIPYTSLQWNRKYYQCGDFSMTVPASVYDPAWRYIETDERPETGIVQKVQYTDDPTYGNDDTVTVSGFFLESIMNRRTFLDETPEEITYRYYVSPPKPPKQTVANRDVYQDASGNYWYSTPSGTTYGVADGTPTDSANRRPGSGVQTDESGQAYIETGSGRVDVEKVSVSSEPNSYYFNSGSTTSINQTVYSSTGEGLVSYGTVQHDIAFDDGFGTTYYHNANGLVAATGVTKQQSDQYVVQKSIWDRTTDNGWVTYTETVAGPWQTTSVEDMTTEMDNVLRVWQWAWMYFQNQMLFVEPSFTGETKIVDPSFELLGDLLYSELQTVEASFRVEYDFQNNQFMFRVWKGYDRTQSTNSPDEASAPMLMSAEPLSDDSGWVGLPSGYTQVEYIEASGTQFIDTGFVANQDSKIVVSYNATAEGFVFGGEVAWKDGSFDVHTHVVAYGNESFNSVNVFNTDIVTTLDKNVFSNTAGQSHTFGAGKTFSTQYTVCLFTTNRSGNNQELMSGRIYYCKVYDNGTQVRNFVPCKRDSDSAAGLYDTINDKFYANNGSGSFNAGPEVMPPADQLTYYPNSTTATGETPPTQGYTGQTVTVSQCGYQLENGTFIGWNTQAEGNGTTYQPGSMYLLTGGSDNLYAQWQIDEPEPPIPSGGKAPWAVFSDTWGTLYGYTGTWDDSNYKNKCFVLYEYDEPSSFDSSGRPSVRAVYEASDDGTKTQTGWRVPYTTKRGYLTVRLEDDYDDRETYLDLRGDAPACDSDWERDEYSIDDYPSAPILPVMESQYANYPISLEEQGKALLNNDYGIITSLETGDLRADSYLIDYDLGDKVDMMVETLGLVQEARIIGVEEAYEAGKSTVNIEIGTPQLDIIKKARIV